MVAVSKEETLLANGERMSICAPKLRSSLMRRVADPDLEERGGKEQTD